MTDPNGLVKAGCAAPGFALPATPPGEHTDPGDFRGSPMVRCRRYGAYTDRGAAARALVVIDPGAAGIQDTLERIQRERREATR